MLPTLFKHSKQMSFEVLEHPLCTPDLAPSDYHLFEPVKNILRGRRFASNHKLNEAVHVWLAFQPKTFSSEGIQKLVQR
jgi:histone-lysine N-methyltransferase SETMAR